MSTILRYVDPAGPVAGRIGLLDGVSFPREQPFGSVEQRKLQTI